MMVAMVLSFLSASPLAADSRIVSTSSSNWSHCFSLLAGGHLTRRCSVTLPGSRATGTWRFRALWGDSGPGSSCVSSGVISVRCISCSFNKHFILAWWIFRPRGFLHILPQTHSAIVVDNPFALVVNCRSVLLGCSFSPPLGHPWGYISLRLSVADLGTSSRKLQVGLLALPTPVAVSPSCPLSLQLSPHMVVIQSVPEHWPGQGKVVKYTSIDALRHIISDGTWGHRVFRVSQHHTP